MLTIRFKQLIFLRLKFCGYLLVFSFLRLQILFKHLCKSFKGRTGLGLHSPSIEKPALLTDSTLLVRLKQFHPHVALKLEVDQVGPVSLPVSRGEGVCFESVECFLLETHLTELV